MAGQASADTSDPALGPPLPLAELSVGTHLSNQFASDGIVFSGQSPYITDDYSSDIEPTISGTPQFAGDVVGTFVSPKTGKPTTLDDFSLVVGYVDSPDSTQMTVLGKDGQQLGVLVASQTGFNQLHSTFSGAASFIVSTVANEPNGWEIQQVRLGQEQSTYLAVGDSYSSGEGTNDFPWSNAQGTDCDSGPEAWPVQLADMENTSYGSQVLTINQQSLIACQGETSAELGEAVNKESASELTQLSQYVADHGEPALVTLTIGGNDVGFAPFLMTCFLGHAATCLTAAKALGDKVNGTGKAQLVAMFTQDYEEVKAAAGVGTPFVVVGYPYLFPAPGTSSTSVINSCGWLGSVKSAGAIVPPLLSQLRIDQDGLESDMVGAARAAGVQFASIKSSVQGHELCTADPYIVPLSFTGHFLLGRNLGHPTPAGQRAIAAAVQPQIDLRPTDTSPLAGDDEAAPAPAAAPAGTPALKVTTTSLAKGVAGVPYLDYLFAGGGKGLDTWAVTSGSLPAGMSLDPSTGDLTGTPTASGTSTFTVQVTDSSKPTAETATASLSVTVAPTPTLAVSAASPPVATVGQLYTTELQSSGGIGPVTWAVTSGTLPRGLSLLSSGAIVGTPAASAHGTTSVTVSATDSEATAQVATASVTVTVDPTTSPLTVGTTSLPSVQAGQPYDAQLVSTGGVAPTQWSLASGTLPPGTSLDPATGAITGTPTEAGTYAVTVQVVDGATPSSQTATAALDLVVGKAPALTLGTSPIPAAATVGDYYSAALHAAGGAGSDTWSIASGPLPPGLDLDEETGDITGTPTAPGTFTFGVSVSDAAGDTASGTFTVTVTGTPLTVSADAPPATVGDYYTGNVVPTGGTGPYTWALQSGDLPAGLAFDTATGAVVGTPTAPGSSTIAVEVTDSASPSSSETVQVTVTVAAAPTLTLSGAALPGGAVGTPYSSGIGFSGGVGPYTWQVSSGALPAGLGIDPASGMITGTPTTVGSSSVTITATDSSPTPETAAGTFTIAVSAAPALSVPVQSLPQPIQGEPYTASLAAAGGTAPYTWAIHGGALPAGLVLDDYDGMITGTPTGDATSTFTVSATDSANPAATATRKTSLAVQSASPVEVTTDGIADLTQGSYTDTELDADGGVGPLTWSVASGALPPGVSLDGDGYLYGSPTAAGFSTVTVEVADAATPDPSTAEETLTIRTDYAPLAAPAFQADEPDQTVPLGRAEDYQFSASGNPTPTFAVTSGSLPAGLTLGSGGLLSGTTSKAGTYDFAVTASNGQNPAATSPTLSIQVVPPPVITSFTPTHGPPGTRVTISGAHLVGDYTDVIIDDGYATVVSDASTKIVATVPEYVGPGSGPIEVETAGGEAVSSASFTVDAAPTPTITSISPLSAPVGATLTITGTGLLDTEYVDFDGAYSESLVTDTATKLEVTVPSGAGTGPVTVATDGGSVTSSQTFTPS